MKKYSLWGEDGWLMASSFAGPALILLIGFLILPLLLAAGVAFTNHQLVSPQPTQFIGLDNFKRLLSVQVVSIDPLPAVPGEARPHYPSWRQLLVQRPQLRGYREAFGIEVAGRRIVLSATDALFYRSLINTFAFALMVMPLQCGIALGLALLVNQRVRGRVIFRTVYFAPVVTSMVVASIVWTFMLNTDRGMINEVLRAISGDPNVGPDWLGDRHYALPAIAVMSAWQGAGLQMLIFLAGLQSIGPELYEAATLMGANAWQRFIYVTLPGLRNTIVFVLVTTTLMALGLFAQVDVMTSGGPLDSTSTLIYHAVHSGFREQDVGYGSAIALVFFMIVLAISLGQQIMSKGAK
ncbi:MAG: sugar transporter permease [Massilia sp.]|jgi:multiple sugar transport system permease protein|nr:sugar transporter permease [Massilia sp.]